jgi:hypothetical protein
MAIRLTNKYTVFIVFLIIIMVAAISYMGSKESMKDISLTINGTTVQLPGDAVANAAQQFGGALQGIVQQVQVMTPTPPR